MFYERVCLIFCLRPSVRGALEPPEQSRGHVLGGAGGSSCLAPRLAPLLLALCRLPAVPCRAVSLRQGPEALTGGWCLPQPRGAQIVFQASFLYMPPKPTFAQLLKLLQFLSTSQGAGLASLRLQFMVLCIIGSTCRLICPSSLKLDPLRCLSLIFLFVPSFLFVSVYLCCCGTAVAPRLTNHSGAGN